MKNLPQGYDVGYGSLVISLYARYQGCLDLGQMNPHSEKRKLYIILEGRRQGVHTGNCTLYPGLQHAIPVYLSETVAYGCAVAHAALPKRATVSFAHDRPAPSASTFSTRTHASQSSLQQCGRGATSSKLLSPFSDPDRDSESSEPGSSHDTVATCPHSRHGRLHPLGQACTQSPALHSPSHLNGPLGLGFAPPSLPSPTRTPMAISAHAQSRSRLPPAAAGPTASALRTHR
ncbi:hypothetical protein DFH08DRAFT_513209 [Mycena albidolilacea]|uniref:Uncharacterized protein n=1 Tax=Mycena albidolilacea TaxID=1033008 RepID=A0AAD6Z4A2_9AGAR|nr:hypothetical protein DFH08DRAFT_513209 [Mycena albidolilacea]